MKKLILLLLLCSSTVEAQTVAQGDQGSASQPWFVTGTVTFDNVSIEIGGSLPAGTNIIGAVNLADVIAGRLPVSAWLGTEPSVDSGLLNPALRVTIVSPSGAPFEQPVSSTNLDIRDLVFTTDKVDVSGSAVITGGLTNTELRASPVPINGTITANAGTGNFTVVQPTGTNLHIVCDSGCGGPTAFADNSAFTFGTTSIGNIGFVFDDVAPNTVTENSAATPRMSGNRIPYSIIRDAAGNERGANVTAANALVVDGSTVTQPVSGTVAISSITTSVTPGTAATNLGKAEDTAHTTGDVGVFILGVRNDGSSTQLTSANFDYSPVSVDAYGAPYARGDHPNRVSCVVSSTAVTSAIITGCTAPGAGLSIYLTSLQWSSSIISTTTNFMTIQSGTGGNCGTAVVVHYRGYQATALGNVNVVFQTAIKAPANTEVCLLHPGAGTRLVSIQGFIAP